MILDFYHNKIVKDTVSERFIESVTANLIPKLSEKYGTALLGIQMYEDYISDNLIKASYAYYPMTVITEDGHATEWIRWSMERIADFTGGIPYSYVGAELIDFEPVEVPPAELAHVLDGRNTYFEGGVVPVEISTVIDSVKLSGKYSQTFLDVLARAITEEIEKVMAVEGVGTSGIRFEMPFAPETYMEHTSENVTYRRLLISDKTSSAKDLWIKWTRLNGAVGFSVCDHVRPEQIHIELGEDVSQKIREKEYRFLTRTSSSKYQAAMGRKNVTEWRELIKRGVRRGDLIKVVSEVETAERAEALNSKLAEILERAGGPVISTPKEEDVIPTPAYSEEFERAMQKAREAVMGSSEQSDEAIEAAQAADTQDIPEITFNAGDGTALELTMDSEEDSATDLDELCEKQDITEPYAEEAPAIIAEPAHEIEESSELTELQEDIELNGEQAFELEDEEELACKDEPSEEEIAELTKIDEPSEHGLTELDTDEPVTAEQPEAFEAAESEAAIKAAESVEKPLSGKDNAETYRCAIDETADLIYRLREEKIRLEVESKLRIEEEGERRRRAEEDAQRVAEEAQRLREEYRRLTLENERLAELARVAEMEKKKEAERRLAEEEKLRQQIENQLRAEAREKERLAEAAQAELERKRRMEEEARIAELERKRLAEERAKREEEERLAAEREAERARILAEVAAKEAAAAAAEEAAEPKYTSYTARLIFRHSVDPNCMSRIQELIRNTVSYFEKDHIKLHVKASIPDYMTVQLDFISIPEEEHELVVNIIKVLGNSDLGISKATLD